LSSPIESELLALANTVRTDDGTILPPATQIRTEERALIEELPQLVKTDTARDLILGDTIGRGGMGLVRVADQSALGRRVAVKTLRGDQKDPALALYLIREAWITGGLEHPNIVPVYALGVDQDGLPMMVMKRIEGTLWTTSLRDPARDLKWHLRILTQVCRAAEFAASRGLIHRDLKPDNVMIGTFGEVYVLDWGIAVSLEDDRGGRLPLAKDVRGISGTPAYMAPEMVSGSGAGLSARTDVYLLGAVLHELITKAQLHQGETVQAVLLAALASERYDYGPDVPNELAAIVDQATAKEPAQRFESSTALREAIELFLERDGSRQLLEQAEQRMAAWAELDGTDAGKVAALYHEARFAFQQALLAWPGNTAAEAGLVGCLNQKLEQDLARDDLDSASAVIAELGEGRPDLDERLEALRNRVAKRRTEIEALRRLEASRNLDVGRRTRAFLMLIAAIGAGGIPLVAHFAIQAGRVIDYRYYYVTGVLKLLGAIALAIWARDTLTRTQVNKQLTITVLMLVGVELIARTFGEHFGRPIGYSLIVDFAAYLLVNTTLAITVDKRLAIGSLFWVIGAIVAGTHIELVHLSLGLCHLGASLNAAAMWRPRHLTGLDPRPA
jgi:hypothetical protein